MASRIVSPDDTTLPISRGDWLRVRKRLTSGENKRMLQRGRLDPIEAGTAKVLAYLLDWSITGPDGKRVTILDASPSALETAVDAIDPESYTEILRAIEAHETAMEAERAAEKNSQDGAKESSAISPSPSGVAGASSGSETLTSMTTRS